MPVPSALLGSTSGPLEHHVDPRWTMAYAASLGDALPCYLDTSAPGGVVAHPLFPVCVEWPVIVGSRQASLRYGLTPDEVRRGVHATHDLTVHRLVRPAELLTTTSTVTGVERRSPGGFTTLRLDTVDAAGEVVATTTQGTLYLGVPVDGPDAPAAGAGPPLAWGDLGPPSVEVRVELSAGAAHVYTECARIWNPIHTDLATARAAGLPGLILHGTATMAYGVSQVVAHQAAGDPTAVRRVLGRFGAMVLLPSSVTVRIFRPVPLHDGATAVPFDVRTAEGGPAVDRAAVILA
jgi:acyl dehydratase